MLRLAAVAIALLPQAFAAHAQQAPPEPRVGDVTEIRIESRSSQSSGDGSSGSSEDRDLLVERVIAVRDGGVELEFDLPRDASAEDRRASWQFPVRVFRPGGGPLRLLNGPELAARVEAWLRAAEWPREMCGRWIFTWNAFRIECDPQSVIETLAAIDLSPGELRDGAPYRDAGARGEAALRREAGGSNGAAFVAEMEVDPDAVRRERARSNAVVLEISGDSPELRAAMQARSAERISGTITTRFETDAAGRVTRRTKVRQLAIERPDGTRETETVTQIVERRLLPRG
jgi:hypothetical protein